ncbi:MAG: hypothetical protein MR274_04055 [Clostridium sp.]|nr:hypothetical protein [Clostridium sp.]MDY3828853.1 hypothetical protein [Clostridium sp.]
MNTFEIDKIQSLDCKFPTYFVDGTCDLDNFYFINNISNSIFVFTRNSKYCTTLKSDKIYCRITYDYCDDSFWAYSEKQKNILFKLDKHMNIIDKLQINICKIQNNFIKSLEYNKANDSLLLNINNEIIEIDKCGNLLNTTSFCDTKFNSVYCFEPYIFDISINNKKNYLNIFNDETNLYHINLPSQFEFKSIICASFSCNAKFNLVLLAHSCKCNYLISVLLDINSLDNANDGYFRLKPCCKKEKSISNNHNSKNDIIQSIALIEASLAHILNAEGEKLQKAICLSSCIDDLLKINNSIQKTITKISNLELQLYSKLSLVLEFCEDEKNKEIGVQ